MYYNNQRDRAPGARRAGPPDFLFVCEIGGPRAILGIENTNKYVAINVQLMYKEFSYFNRIQ